VSRAINLSMTVAQVDRHCRDNHVAISALEALPDGGARLVCMSNYGASRIRSKLRGHVLNEDLGARAAAPGQAAVAARRQP